MKVLNLYAGIGGNRKLWEGCEVTAVEYDKNTAEVYADYFPNDNIIVDDAHDYLISHYKEFDFIWSSPPCPSHSKLNNTGLREKEYPDMRLYEEIIFLEKWAECKWVVENVDPYYQPLRPAQKLNRHLFWANFKIGRPDIKETVSIKYDNDIQTLANNLGFDLEVILGSKIKNKRKALRNCVQPELGEHIFNRAKGILRKKDISQIAIFPN